MNTLTLITHRGRQHTSTAVPPRRLRPTLLALTLASLVAACSTTPSGGAADGVASATAQPASTASQAVNAALQPASAATQVASALAPATVSRTAPATALYELVWSARQNAVYAVSAGGFGDDAPPSRVLKLDPQTLAVQAEIALPRKGFGLALDDAADRLYVGNTVDAAVTVIDTQSHQVVGSIQLAEKVAATDREGKPIQRYPHNFRQLVLDPAAHRLYMPGLTFDDSALYVVDTRAQKVEKVIPGFGFVATGIALSPDHKQVFVSNLAGQLYTVDTSTLSITGKAEVQADQLLNLVYDSRNGRLLATDQGFERLNGMRKTMGKLDYTPRGAGNRVVAIEPASGKLLASIPTGNQPVALELDESRNRLFVTNRDAGTVSVIDATSYAPLQTVTLPTHPNSLALDPASGTVYATVKNGEKDAKGSNESIARLAF